MTKTSAAKAAGICRRTAHRIEDNPLVQDEIRLALDKAGATADKIAQVIARNLDAQKVISANVIAKSGDEMADAHGATKDFIEVPDNMAQIKAAELAGKFRRDFVDRVEHSGNIGMTDHAAAMREAKKKAEAAVRERLAKKKVQA